MRFSNHSIFQVVPGSFFRPKPERAFIFYELPRFVLFRAFSDIKSEFWPLDGARNGATVSMPLGRPACRRPAEATL